MIERTPFFDKISKYVFEILEISLYSLCISLFEISDLPTKIQEFHLSLIILPIWKMKFLYLSPQMYHMYGCHTRFYQKLNCITIMLTGMWIKYMYIILLAMYCLAYDSVLNQTCYKHTNLLHLVRQLWLPLHTQTYSNMARGSVQIPSPSKISVLMNIK